jgi:arsenate reductase
MRVLFACIHNAGRSQIAQALFERLAAGRHEARSAGSRPGPGIHPVGGGAMRGGGMDLGSRRPQSLTPELAAWADLVVTMGCGDECPYVPGLRSIDWDLPDPADRPLAEVRKVRDEIARRLQQLLQELDSAPLPRQQPGHNVGPDTGAE